jgi:HAD superfamily hydrolase (TIGR01484 family)
MPKPIDRALPLSTLPAETAAQVRGVFTDIDDTLTCEGAIMPEALQALRGLADAGIPVIAITGRPLGWSESFAREWPLAAIVAENGAVALIRERDGVHTEFVQDATTRERNAARLKAVAQRLEREMPHTALARDSAGRVTDIAVDHSEFTHLSEADIARVVALMQSEGLNATVSSIHINGWIGDHDKLSGARWMLQRLYGRALDGERERWLYVGDSTNDQGMFAYFALSVGVANLLRFASQLQVWPAYLTQGERGRGFAEAAGRLLQARRRPGW